MIEINIQDDNESKKRKLKYNILTMENKMARETNKKHGACKLRFPHKNMR